MSKHLEIGKKLEFWSKAGSSVLDPRLSVPATIDHEKGYPLEMTGRYYKGIYKTEQSGTLVINIWSPRSLRLWVNRKLILDETLFWRSFQREVRATSFTTVNSGQQEIFVEVGRRSNYFNGLDETCPSRNRATVLQEIEKIIPDVLRFELYTEDKDFPSASVRFLTGQFQEDGYYWQQTLFSRYSLFDEPSSGELVAHHDLRLPAVSLSTAISHASGRLVKSSTSSLRQEWYLPVKTLRDAHLISKEPKVEPSLAVVQTTTLSIQTGDSTIEVPMPVYETLGIKAPPSEIMTNWPNLEETMALVPEPLLSAGKGMFVDLYRAAWAMLLDLKREPRAESGLPPAFISTGSGFPDMQFLWDTCFAAMAAVYGHKALPVYAGLDLLYSRQFESGYIHRETDLRDGMPVLFEPDYSPNPPLLAVAEWFIASITGNKSRLESIYPLAAAYHRWLETNRKLPDGTYWTTGLANGLDNSPSLGEGYPDLTAQMAHDAEVLGRIASILGYKDEACAWEAEAKRTAQVLNDYLWSSELQFYSTSLASGGHNRNKIVTGFWPLWAGCVPKDRVSALLAHARDRKSFWRYHPFPSLAADAPGFDPQGSYWRGSTWAPTNFAAIKGFWRAGQHEFARECARIHLLRMHEVWTKTGKIWENYSSESAAPGNSSMPDYCWSALGPINLLLEVVMGLEPDALHQTIRWNLDVELIPYGVNRYPLGDNRIDLKISQNHHSYVLSVCASESFKLYLMLSGKVYELHCPVGETSVSYPRLVEHEALK